MEEWNLVDWDIFSIEIDFTPLEVIHYVGITSTTGITGRCGKSPENKAKVKNLVIPFQPSCQIEHVSGTYLDTPMGDPEFKAGLYGLSFIINC